ncbi:MAG: cobalamin-binding protein [Treponemataceae bacterium]
MKKKIFCCTLFFLISSLFFAQRYNRVVSLSPAVTEIIYAIGAGSKLVARTDMCDFPAAAKKLPSIGGFDGKTFSVESILKYNPDIVILVKDMHDFMIPVLKKLGLFTYMVSTASVADMLDEIRQLGEFLNVVSRSNELIINLKSTLFNFEEKNKGKEKISVFFELFSSPFMTIGKNNFISEIITVAGGENIFNTIDIPYPVVSIEGIMSKNPQVILLPTDSVSPEEVSQRKNWEKITAVQNNFIYEVDANIFLRPGPRLLIAVRRLDEILSNVREELQTQKESLNQETTMDEEILPIAN